MNALHGHHEHYIIQCLDSQIHALCDRFVEDDSHVSKSSWFDSSQPPAKRTDNCTLAGNKEAAC